MINNRIMVLSKSESVCMDMAAYLEESRYSVIGCSSYAEAVKSFSEEGMQIDLLLFDMEVPFREEYTVIQNIREVSDVRMIILSKDERLDSQLYAYSMKVDDYMIKPAPLPLIEAHIEAIFRRDTPKNPSTVKTAGAVSIDYEGRRVYLAGKPMDLTAKEFDMMDYFLEHKGVVLSRDKILDAVWGYDYVGGYRSVDTLIKKIRAKMTNDYPYIRTIYGVGYCFDV